jgi:hypothetical protein
LIGVYFRRLKINHDTHEFILESGTVTNTFSKVVLKVFIMYFLALVYDSALSVTAGQLCKIVRIINITDLIANTDFSDVLDLIDPTHVTRSQMSRISPTS